MERKIYKQLDIDTFNKVALELSKKKKESQPIIMCFPLQECIDRDSKRPNPIGEEVIRKTYEKYKDIIEGDK